MKVIIWNYYFFLHGMPSHAQTYQNVPATNAFDSSGYDQIKYGSERKIN